MEHGTSMQRDIRLKSGFLRREVPMAPGKRRPQQPELRIATTDLPRSPGHPFSTKLNQLLAEAHFDPFVEQTCRASSAPDLGRPSIPPGVSCRMLLIGSFEG